MTTTFIGLGSNLQQPVQQLDNALSALRLMPQSTLYRCSSYYDSKAIGPGTQPDYVNAVACLHTSLSAHDLLYQLQGIERSQGRKRTTRWGARTLDLDLLLYGTCVLHDRVLTLPHPLLQQRNFVITPLYEIAPDLVLPDGGALSKLFENTTQDKLWKLRHEGGSGPAGDSTCNAGDDTA